MKVAAATTGATTTEEPYATHAGYGAAARPLLMLHT